MAVTISACSSVAAVVPEAGMGTDAEAVIFAAPLAKGSVLRMVIDALPLASVICWPVAGVIVMPSLTVKATSVLLTGLPCAVFRVMV